MMNAWWVCTESAFVCAARDVLRAPAWLETSFARASSRLALGSCVYELSVV